MAKEMRKETFYGSGKVYSAAYDKSTFPKIADAKKITSEEATALTTWLKGIMTEDNQVGYLKNGFDILVETETLTDQSDLGEMKIDTITKEKGTCTFSLFNCSLETIADQYPTAAYSKDSTSNVEVTEVGGLDNMDDTEHVIVFFHSDTQNGDTVAVCVGKNMSGFENAWKQDSVTPFTCKFNMQPYTDTGRFYRLVHTPKDYKWAE